MKSLNPSQKLAIITSVSIIIILCVSFNKSSNANDNNQLKSNTIHQINAMNDDEMENLIDNAVFNIVMGYDNDNPSNTGSKRTADSEMGIESQSEVYPHTVTIDYGKGCTNANGITKKGKLIITYFQPANAPQAGTISETNFEYFFIDNIQVHGELTINNITSPYAPYPGYEYSGFKVLSYTNGAYKKYNTQRIFTQTKGAETPNLEDDEFYVSGFTSNVSEGLQAHHSSSISVAAKL